MVEVAPVDLASFDRAMHGDGGAAMSAAADVKTELMEHLKDLHLPAIRRVLRGARRGRRSKRR